MTEKQCPYRFKLIDNTGKIKNCIKEKCRFWTSAYTTENIQIFECAKVIEALKNSDGKIPV
jgi:hypothetical protein